MPGAVIEQTITVTLPAAYHFVEKHHDAAKAAMSPCSPATAAR